VLRALASVGVFHHHDDGSLSLTPIGECLRADAPLSHGAAPSQKGNTNRSTPSWATGVRARAQWALA
jgi:hypothetical protein